MSNVMGKATVQSEVESTPEEVDTTAAPPEDVPECPTEPECHTEPKQNGLSEEQMAALIEEQRRISEHVGGMEEQMRRVRVTSNTRISDLNSSQFTSSGPKAKMQQIKLVEASVAAMKKFNASGNLFSTSDAHAICEEFVVAIMNDLMLNSDTEGFFGVTIPDWDRVDAVYWSDEKNVNMFSTGIIQETIGLFVYRAWQLMLRTPKGRVVFVDTAVKQGFIRFQDTNPVPVAAASTGETSIDSQDNTAEEKLISDYHSFDIVVGVLAKCLKDRNLLELFQSVLHNMPVTSPGSPMETATLLDIERSSIDSAINEKTLDWRMPRR